MVAGLALVLSLAVPQAASPEAAPAPPSAGTPAPAQRVVRPADAPPPIVIEAPPPETKSEKPAPDSAEELQMQIDALRAENAKKLQREIDALREHSSAKIQLQVDALQGRQSAQNLQQQIDFLRESRPSLVPPLIVFGLGISFLIAGAILSSSSNNDAYIFLFVPPEQMAGVGLIVAGSVVSLVGLIWLIVDATLRGDLDRKIDALEFQQWNASSGVRVTPWARDGAGGLALSLQLP